MTTMIVGLGNPGEEYINTRHNVGFAVLGTIAKTLDVTWKFDGTAHANIIETNIDGNKVILAKPQTFMNLSGETVAALKQRFTVDSARIWVVSDDACIDLGVLRVRSEGSAGGHNGLRSIIDALGTQAFPRFRVGIGIPPDAFPLEKYVLARFTPDERKIIDETIRKAASTILASLTSGIVETTQ